MPMYRTVRAVNDLTARWARQAPAAGRNAAFSGPGAWAPLALLAAGSAGPAARELADALGVPTGEAAGAGRELLAALDRTPGVSSALGVWTRDRLPLEPAWTAALPPHSLGRITGDPDADRAALDAWAADRTAGQIPRMPVGTTPDTELVLAGALTVRTDWIRRFQSYDERPEAGAWRGRTVAGLYRVTGLLDRVGVADTAAGPLTVLTVLGLQVVDVHLCLGPEDAAPGAVLAAAVRTAEHPARLRPGTALPDGAPGPGLEAGWVRSYTREPLLLARTVEFDLADDHDLLHRPDLFGLRTATDTGTGHFPGISPDPLAVTAARQSATAVFGPRGFRAAAVTAFGLAVGAAATRPPYAVRRITATFDRPFAFLAVHRTSRLVLAAGWVADPKPPAPQPDDLEPDDLDW
ncbi:serpin (serine protease inhibitor) [Kitasatospora cineracea]|uniref:Serpin (Serine protease inhibitor) n=2 Tax=Kitasatospora cineracea TaxID=88074 RepID=A0A3N4R7S8_9ACTN|nr:serpin family protein [Kitasatospora cineracea]RPE28716.1 serpin (serine protease inhibitor) [Kitasatospora cineracea]